MAPKRYQTAKAEDTCISQTSDKDELVKARAIKRAERVKARYEEAEKHKEIGNAYFRKGQYRKAIEKYETAIKIHGPSTAYLANMAAAWLKLDAYGAAEHCAQRALVIDPTFMKARYRRGLARKGSLQLYAATLDFEVILEQDPDSIEAKKALQETINLMNRRTESEGSVVIDETFPSLDEPKLELESVSDSSDWNHEGNGIPCRFYNHEGCMRGTECRFSHAPDHKSVRDHLGRNVCMYFLLEDCRFGRSACVYSHDKTYLPSGRWWDDDDLLVLLKQIAKGPGPKENSAFMPYMCGLADNHLAWASAHGVEMEEDYVHWRDLALNGFRNAVDDGCEAEYKHRNRGIRGGRGRGRGGGGGMRLGGWQRGLDLDDFEDSDEEEERRNNFGFTEDEAMELLCQGVKPWDDDAWDVLDALNSL
ncbi:hypothetical protein EI94DRAFT_1727155 [Lactarius quietus]|nr:hypothetical protein EI94DRAFT_1727155 [Lactarius quietus]